GLRVSSGCCSGAAEAGSTASGAVAVAVERAGRPVRAVAHGVEDVETDAVHALQVADPERGDIGGVIVDRLGDRRIVGLAADDLIGDPGRRRPRTRLLDAERLAFAGEGELAGEWTVAVLIDHAADRGRIDAAADAVEHHLRDRRLAGLGLRARLEIDRLGQTAHLTGAVLGVDERGEIGLAAAEERLARDRRLPRSGVDLDVDHHAVGRRRGHRVQRGLERRGRRRAVGDGETRGVWRLRRLAGAAGAHGVVGIELGFARVFGALSRVALRIRVEGGRAAAPARVEARPQADERIALAASVDVRKSSGASLEGAVRLDLVGLAVLAGVAGHEAAFDQRRRRS